MNRLTAPAPFSLADFVLFGFIFSSLFFTVVYQITGFHTEFSTGFAQEDGPAEWGTAVALFLAAIILFRHSMVSWGRHGAVTAVILLVYSLIFVFGAGEEISWGQRIFGWESGDYFAENNFQNETNLHNLVVGEKQLTKTLFGPILTLVLVLYLVVMPLLYPRQRWVRSFARILRVPVPSTRHAVIALTASIVVALVALDRKWEVYEFIFGLLAMSIFLAPQNSDEIC